jgi:HEAT repeat protein
MNSRLSKVVRFVFDHGPAWLRRLTVRALSVGSPALPADVVALAMRDKSASVRLVAVRAMADHPRWADVDALAAALRDADAAVRLTAVQALAEFRSVPAGRYLQTALKDPVPKVRATAAWGLGRICTLAFSPAQEKALEDRDAEVRAYAARALGWVGRAEALVPLRAMAARDPVSRNREWAQWAVEEAEKRTAPMDEKRRQARYDLTQVLLDETRPWSERMNAKACLMRIKGASLVPILDQALDATNKARIHPHIMGILVRLTPCKDLQNVLIRVIRHPSPPVRRLAIEALGDFADREAIFHLSEVAREGQELYQMLTKEDADLALEAIQKIRSRMGQGLWMVPAIRAIR